MEEVPEPVIWLLLRVGWSQKKTARKEPSFYRLHVSQVGFLLGIPTISAGDALPPNHTCGSDLYRRLAVTSTALPLPFVDATPV